jgi:hypothetical protein
MDEPLETTEMFKKLSGDACQQSYNWNPIMEDQGVQVYECNRTDAHNKLIEQFVKDHVCATEQSKAHQANVG